MVKLAEIQTTRDWITIRKDDPRIRVDFLEQFWYVERLRISSRAPSDVVDEAIGKYQSDQRGSWIRTFCPLYWIGHGIDWLVSEAFNIVRIFGGNPETARGFPGWSRRSRFRTIHRVDWRCSRFDRDGALVLGIR